MSLEEIVDSAAEALRYGLRTVVLQAGEDPGLPAEWVAELIRRIKSLGPVAITLSLGERPDDELLLWRKAGADRYLLRFETSNPILFRLFHPAGPAGRGRDRLEMLASLRRLDYEVGSGVLIGLPGQSWSDLARDLILFTELDLDMIGSGPFIPHPHTPLGDPELAEREGLADEARQVLSSAPLITSLPSHLYHSHPFSQHSTQETHSRWHYEAQSERLEGSEAGGLADHPNHSARDEVREDRNLSSPRDFGGSQRGGYLSDAGKSGDQDRSSLPAPESKVALIPWWPTAAPTEQVPADDLTTYKVLALTRILCPWSNIPATTALATVNPNEGRRLALRRGANVIMPNFTPLKYRELYEIYPNKAGKYLSPKQTLAKVLEVLQAEGRPPGTGPGVSPNYLRRKGLYPTPADFGPTVASSGNYPPSSVG
jgi:biotin synthase-like enzyme